MKNKNQTNKLSLSHPKLSKIYKENSVHSNISKSKSVVVTKPNYQEVKFKGKLKMI